MVLVFTRHGAGTAGFLRDVKYSRQRLKVSSQELERVGSFEDLAKLAVVAASMKPPGPPSWKRRMAVKRRRRTKELRKRKLNHRPLAPGRFPKSGLFGI
jgi:hypothetical protein